MGDFKTLDDLDVAGKRVMVRADLNVPMRDGEVTDFTRIDRLVPTLAELRQRGARVIVLSSVTPMGSNKAVQARMLGADGLVSKPSGAVSYDLEQKRGSELVEMAYRVLGIAAA